MSGEPRQLAIARDHLSRAERQYRTDDGLFHLEEGLALLEEIIASADADASRIAGNLLATYAAKVYAVAERAVETDPNLPEPELERLFKLILAFDHYSFELPAEARKTKVALVRRLVDRYLEGYPPAQKQAAMEELAKISGIGPALPRAGKAARRAGKAAPRRKT